jgi:hypothetical protein
MTATAGRKAYLKRVHYLAGLLYGDGALLRRMDQIGVILGKHVDKEAIYELRERLKARAEFVRKQ